MKQPETNKYQDIIHLSRPRSKRHPPMSAHDRAGQFSPFAALTGFEAAIAETQRLTDSRITLEEGAKELLGNRKLWSEQTACAYDCFCREHTWKHRVLELLSYIE